MTTAPASCSTSDLPIVVIDRRRQHFFMIENAVLDRYGKELGAYGVTVYNVLSRYANREGESYPSQTTIGNLVNMSRKQVIREIDKLKRLGLIAVQPQYGSSGGQRANLYTILDLPATEEPVTHRRPPCVSQSHPPVTESDTPRHRQSHKQDTVNKTQTEQDTAEQAVVVALVNQGISEKVALKLAKNYSKAHLEEKLEYLVFLMAERPESIQKPCGWLRKAIEEDYAAPDGYMSAEERAAEEIEAKQREEERQQIIEEQQELEVAEQQKEYRKAEAQMAALHDAYGTTQQEFDLWKLLLQEFKIGMPTHTFYEYVENTMLLSLKDDQALIGLSNPRGRDWLENRFSKKIERTLSTSLKQKVSVRFIDLNPAAQLAIDE